MLAAVAAAAARGDAAPLTVERLAELRLITDPRHPAVGSYGLFAKVRIQPGTVITPYSGFTQHSRDAPLPGSETYGMAYISHPDLVVDAEFAGNYARFANDPRNTGRTANIVAQNKVTRLGENVTVLVARTVIYPHDELLLDYGRGHACVARPWEDRWGNVLTRPRMTMKTHVAPAASPPGELSFLWQCGQCGQFNQTLSVPIVACMCARCAEPRASHCGAVALTALTAARFAQRYRRLVQSPRINATGLEPTACEEMPSTCELHDARDDHLTLTRGCASVSASWPLNFPYLTWQVWDPEVAPSTILEMSSFVQQPRIALGEWRDGVYARRYSGRTNSGQQQHHGEPPQQEGAKQQCLFTTESIPAETEVAVAGGLVLRSTDPRARHHQAVVPLTVHNNPPTPEVLNKTNHQLDDLNAMGLCLIITNELRHITFLPQNIPPFSGEEEQKQFVPTCRWRLTVDALGCIYLALVSTRDLQPWQQLTVADPRVS